MNTSYTAFGGDFSSKQALRQQHERWRRALSPKQVAARGHRVFEQLQRLPCWHTSLCTALYAAQAFEVPTSVAMKTLWKAHKQLCLPSSAASPSPSLALVCSAEDLEADRYGILCPKAHCPPVAIAQVELIVVPGVAFAQNGARLGRGGGFYDKLLAHPDMKALRVGLCFEECLVQSLPEDASDQRMHWVVTDNRSIQGLPRDTSVE